MKFTMSTSDSSSKGSCDMSTDDNYNEYEALSNHSDIESWYQRGTFCIVSQGEGTRYGVESQPWIDDPVADDEWLAQHENNTRESEIHHEEMAKRLAGSVELTD